MKQVSRPDIAAQTGSSLMANLVDQLTTKLQAGEAVDWDEVARAHPQHVDELRQLWPALAVLDELSRSGASGISGVAVHDSANGNPTTGVLGDFRIVREVGRGGMGIVYEAEQISLGRRVALKVLPLASTMDPRRLQRFHNEAKAAACLHHTHIVPVFAVGSERGVHFYAMQFIDGQTLAAVIHDLKHARKSATADPREGPSTTPETPAAAVGSTAPEALLSTSKPGGDAAYFRKVAELGADAAEALDYAHQMGVVHRDIKPGNLMLDGRGTVWVADFGLALLQTEAGVTMTGDLVGTLRYMSPEQALAKRGLIDHRTDVYSLGATLYELLTLRPVFLGDDRQELLRQIAFDEPLPLRRVNRAIPAELETIVLKALERNPADRYATAQELADDLNNFCQDRPIKARRQPLLTRFRRWARRHKALVTSCILVLLTALLLGGGGLGWQQLKLAAVEQAVGADLREADLLQNEERWPEALQVLERAAGRLATGGSQRLREGVELRRKNVAMVAELEEARLQQGVRKRPGKGGRGFDYQGADQRYKEALAGYGLDLEALSPEEAAQRIRSSAIRVHLIAALDNWADNREQLRSGAGESLMAVARLADDDLWRQQLSRPRVARDLAALQRLAEHADVQTQPPAILVLLSHRLRAVRGGERRRNGSCRERKNSIPRISGSILNWQFSYTRTQRKLQRPLVSIASRLPCGHAVPGSIYFMRHNMTHAQKSETYA